MVRSCQLQISALRKNFLDKIVVENLPDIHDPGPHVVHIFSKSRSNNSVESYFVAIATDVEALRQVSKRDRDGSLKTNLDLSYPPITLRHFKPKLDKEWDQADNDHSMLRAE